MIIMILLLILILLIKNKHEINLAIELEKRGKIIVRDESKQRELINIVHLQGHFGVTSCL